eukprot:9995027-Lingulodinium_polyedra.AAC.1
MSYRAACSVSSDARGASKWRSKAREGAKPSQAPPLTSLSPVGWPYGYTRKAYSVVDSFKCHVAVDPYV